jgi:PGF-pre-PGF domain-containing protein
MRKRWIVLSLIFLVIILTSSFAVLSASNPVFRSTKIWSYEESGEHIFFISSVEIAVTEIRFETADSLNFTKMMIEAGQSAPASLENLENSYQYLTIGKFGISDSAIHNILIKFRVDKNWVSNNSDYNAVNLYYYENGWNKIKTSYIFDDQTYYYYEAEPQKLIYFAVRGEKSAFVSLNQIIKQKETDNYATITNINLTAETLNSSNINKENSLLNLFFSEKRNTYLFISALLGALLIIAILSAFGKIIIKGDYYENTDEIHKLVEEEMSEGVPKKDIEKEIISKGWKKSLVDKIVHSEKLPHVVEIKLNSYVKAMRKKMFSDQEIKKSLLKEGWPEETIDELINKINA